MASKTKNTLPIPAHVQSIADALEAINPAHWTARHGQGGASNQWMVYSEVLRGRIDDCKQNGEKGRGGYRIGILLADYDGKIQTSFSLFDCGIAAKRFKTNFRSEMVEPLIALHSDGYLECEGTTMRSGKTKRITTSHRARSAYWINRWLIDPRYYNEAKLDSFQIDVGIIHYDTSEQITQNAEQLAAAYLPLLTCMMPLDGEPIDPKRLTRSASLRRNLICGTSPAEQCSCEHHRIDGLNSRFTCSGRLEAAHIEPYQQGGSDDASNGLWLCPVHHCETEGRIAGDRLSVRLLEHIPQKRRSRRAC